MAGPSNKNETTEVNFITEVEKFDFSNEAIDASLRKLLAKVVLPKEAQQIDRAMEAFAKHYHECNSNLVDNPDVVYSVSFSILLLHTDAHNKNVRQKMNKETFIKRTKIIDGGKCVPDEILDVMYDNVVASEFTYAHNNKVTTVRPARSNSWFSKLKNNDNLNNNVQSIALLNDLNQKLEQLMPRQNTFQYKDPIKPLPIMKIHSSILKAKQLNLSGVRSRHQDSDTCNTFTIKVVKAGRMDRKYDFTQGGKRATARGWRPMGIILSGCQLIFFGDLTTFQSYLNQNYSVLPELASKRNHSFPTMMKNISPSHLSVNSAVTPLSSSYQHQQILNKSQSSDDLLKDHIRLPIPASSISNDTTNNSQLRPVQIVSLLNAICLHDIAYTKYPHVFRLITGDGQQFLLRAEDESEMNDWMLKINYAAALKTTGVKIKASSPKKHHIPIDRRYERSRREEKALEKIKELTDSIQLERKDLEREIQLRDNLMALNPIQKSTKDKIIAFAEITGRKIKAIRIDLKRLECYREYIECELDWFNTQYHYPSLRKMSLPNSPSYAYHIASPLPLSHPKMPHYEVEEGAKNQPHSLYTASGLLSPNTSDTTATSNSASSNKDLTHSSSTSSSSDEACSDSLNKSQEDYKSLLSEAEEEVSEDQSSKLPFQKVHKPQYTNVDKIIESDRVVRRRSQSNPILPVDKKISLLGASVRDRSGSTASSTQGDEDDMSVVIVNDSDELLAQ